MSSALPDGAGVSVAGAAGAASATVVGAASGAGVGVAGAAGGAAGAGVPALFCGSPVLAAIPAGRKY